MAEGRRKADPLIHAEVHRGKPHLMNDLATHSCLFPPGVARQNVMTWYRQKQKGTRRDFVMLPPSLAGRCRAAGGLPLREGQTYLISSFGKGKARWTCNILLFSLLEEVK